MKQAAEKPAKKEPTEEERKAQMAPIVHAFAAGAKLPTIKKRMGLVAVTSPDEDKMAAEKQAAEKPAKKEPTEEERKAQMAPIVNAFAAASKLPAMKKRMGLVAVTNPDEDKMAVVKPAEKKEPTEEE